MDQAAIGDGRDRGWCELDPRVQPSASPSRPLSGSRRTKKTIDSSTSASDRFDEVSRPVLTASCMRIAGRNHRFSSIRFGVNLMSGEDRFAVAAKQINEQYPDRLGTRLHSQTFGNRSLSMLISIHRRSPRSFPNLFEVMPDAARPLSWTDPPPATTPPRSDDPAPGGVRPEVPPAVGAGGAEPEQGRDGGRAPPPAVGSGGRGERAAEPGGEPRRKPSGGSGSIWRSPSAAPSTPSRRRAPSGARDFMGGKSRLNPDPRGRPGDPRRGARRLGRPRRRPQSGERRPRLLAVATHQTLQARPQGLHHGQPRPGGSRPACLALKLEKLGY